MVGHPHSVVIIPARLESQRLPRKLLRSDTGKPLIQHTYEAATKAKKPHAVYVATDSEEIARAVQAFGGQVLMTSSDIRSGTDRIAAAAQAFPSTEIIVNVQGDEPEIEPTTIDALIELMTSSDEPPMATMAAPIRDWETLDSPNCVKVVRNCRGDALYFSRAPIPFPRDRDQCQISSTAAFLHHLGIYAYRRTFLLDFVKLAPSPYEAVESLEQLRVLEAGYKIRVGVVSYASPGIDTQDEYIAFVKRCQSRPR